MVGGHVLLLCDCGGSIPLEGVGDGRPARILCRDEIGRFRTALAKGSPVMVACRQEMALFDEVRAETAPDCPVTYVDIRDRAGWSDEAAAATPKLAALLAEAAINVPPVRAVGLESGGTVLVLGRDEAALAAARQLAVRLDASLLLVGEPEVALGSLDDLPVFRGAIRAARGHLGAFELTVDGHAGCLAHGRGGLRFGRGRDGVAVQADIVVDLTGGTPLFPDHWRRDGYLRPDPRDPAAVQKALFEATGLVGSFEKPRYIAVRPERCAHSRNSQPGCTRCLDVCPTGAAAPDGAAVAIDPQVCAGCGSCAAACPTGALAYQLPDGDTLFARLRTLLQTYRAKGGRAPLLLVHDGDGYELLAAAARHGSGLPARVLPFAVNEVTQLGFDHLAVAMALGAEEIRLLLPRRKRDEGAGLARQVALFNAAAAGLGHGDDRAAVLDEETPDGLSRSLYRAAPRPSPQPADFVPRGERRGVTRLALSHLHAEAPSPVDAVELPAGAPFGDVVLDEHKCTLCMACTQACPTGALAANPDRPQLSFTETACVQCGLCRSTCPEAAVTLVPRLAFTAAARSPRVLKEDQPALCVRCGKPFGIGGVIERMAAALADRHPMFMGEAAKKLRMCEDCRVIVQFEAEQPMAGAPPRRPRTTDDDLRERERQ